MYLDVLANIIIFQGTRFSSSFDKLPYYPRYVAAHFRPAVSISHLRFHSMTLPVRTNIFITDAKLMNTALLPIVYDVQVLVRRVG